MSVWLPTWATDLVRRRLRQEGSAPDSGRGRSAAVLLTDQFRGREIVVRRCASAAAFGVSPGLDLAHARSLIPSRVRLHVEAHRPERDAAALHRLACWALRFSPVSAADPPNGLLLDATGLERLYRKSGEAGLARAVGGAISRLGFAVRVAVAPTFACAQAVARFGKDAVAHVPAGGEREALAPLPVEALCDDGQTEAALREIGLTRVGHVLDLPRAALAAQFGDALLRRVDRALGRAPELIEPVRPDPPPRAELVFEGPTDRWEVLEAAAREVLDRLLAALAPRGHGVRRLDLEVLHADRGVSRKHVELSCASRSRKHLWTMLRPTLERVDTGRGVESVALVASGLRKLTARQAALAGLEDESASADDDAAWGEIIDTLVSGLGADNVVRFDPVASHLPEQAFCASSFMRRTAPAITAGIVDTDRPTRLFDSPLPAAVMLRTPDGPILDIAWSGRTRKVIACRGPERIAAEWWRSPPTEAPAETFRERDYFAVQTEDGAWLWLVRQVETGRWFVHGDWA